MKLEQFLTDVLNNAIHSQKNSLNHDNANDSFENDIKAAKDSSVRSEIVEIGDNKFKIDFDQQKPKYLTQDTEEERQAKSDTHNKKQESVQSAVNEPSPNLFVNHFSLLPLIKTIQFTTFTQQLQSFLQETVAVIQQIQMSQESKQTSFQFRNPPLTVLFDSSADEIKIKVQSYGGDETLKQDLIDNRDDLLMSLQKVFEDKEVSIGLEIEFENQHSNKGENQDPGQNQSEDEVVLSIEELLEAEVNSIIEE